MFTSRLPGALLLTLAFLALTAEGAARTDPGISGLFVATSDVLAVLWPERLVSLEIWVTRTLGAGAWDPVMVTILALPAWVILGGLGIGLLWLSARNAPALDDGGADAHQLFEDLARAAEAEGMRDSDADMGPSTTMASDITPEHGMDAKDETADASHEADDNAAPLPPTR